MARIYSPLELLKDGKPSGVWHMTVKSDEETWPAHAVGACARGCPGHLTAEQAEAHWTDGEADEVRYGEDRDEQRKCGICGTWTILRASTTFHVFALCEKHRNRDDVHYLLIAARTGKAVP